MNKAKCVGKSQAQWEPSPSDDGREWMEGAGKFLQSKKLGVFALMQLPLPRSKMSV